MGRTVSLSTSVNWSRLSWEFNSQNLRRLTHYFANPSLEGDAEDKGESGDLEKAETRPATSMSNATAATNVENDEGDDGGEDKPEEEEDKGDDDEDDGDSDESDDDSSSDEEDNE